MAIAGEGRLALRAVTRPSARLKKRLAKHEWATVAVAVGLAMVVTTLLAFVFIGSSGRVITPDANAYYDRSFHPFEKSGDAPYIYRLLTPFLVNLLPMDHLIGFGLVNSAGFALLLFLTYYYIKRLSASKVYGLLGIAFLASCPVFVYTLSNTCLTDSLSFVFLIAAFIGLLERNDKLYLIALTVGVLNKETILLTVPLYFLLALEKRSFLISLRNSVAVALPAVAILLAVRVYFGTGEYHSAGTIEDVLEFHSHESILRIGFLAYSTFGVLWLLFLFGLKKANDRFLRYSLVFVPLVFAQLIIATDIARMLFIAFPVVMPIAFACLREARADKSRSLILPLTAFLTLIPLGGMALYYRSPGFIDPGLHNMYLDMSLLALQAAIATMVLLFDRETLTARTLSS